MIFNTWFVLLHPNQQDSQLSEPHVFLGKLDYAVYQYLVQTLSLVNHYSSYWMSGRKDYDCFNYIKINLYGLNSQSLNLQICYFTRHEKTSTHRPRLVYYF